MAGMDEEVTPPPEVLSYYAAFPEESRLGFGPFRLEFERTKEILARVLPGPPGRIVDVGGAAGAYSLWLAEQGYEVHLVDTSPRLVEEARTRSAKSATPIASLSVADALEAAGFRDVRIFGVEGPGWILPDFDARWEDTATRKDLLDVARALESESSIVGVSAHLLGIGRKP